MGDDVWDHSAGGKEGARNYRDLIETYSAGHKSPGFEELDQVAAEIVGLAAREVLNALAPQTPF